MRLTIALRFLTAASAMPLNSRLYADANSCCIELALQNSANSCQNCGHPSVRMDLGQPKELNMLESSLVILAVCVPLSCVSHVYPTVASHFFPIASNRSVPISSIGRSTEVGFGAVASGLV